jgi:hypothetical protein
MADAGDVTLMGANARAGVRGTPNIPGKSGVASIVVSMTRSLLIFGVNELQELDEGE